MASKRMILLVGVPAAGKSTYIETVLADTPLAIASSDNIIEAIAAEEGLTYDDVFTKYVNVAEKMMYQDIEKYIKDGWETIVVDRTNVSVKARKKILDFMKGRGFRFEAVVFQTPQMDEWNRRLGSRPGKTIPRHVLDSMACNLVIPTEEEGFSKITFL